MLLGAEVGSLDSAVMNKPTIPSIVYGFIQVEPSFALTSAQNNIFYTMRDGVANGHG